MDNRMDDWTSLIFYIWIEPVYWVEMWVCYHFSHFSSFAVRAWSMDVNSIEFGYILMSNHVIQIRTLWSVSTRFRKSFMSVKCIEGLERLIKLQFFMWLLYGKSRLYKMDAVLTMETGYKITGLYTHTWDRHILKDSQYNPTRMYLNMDKLPSPLHNVKNELVNAGKSSCAHQVPFNGWSYSRKVRFWFG